MDTDTAKASLMRSTVEKYRALVRKAATGQGTEIDTASALSALASMGLPDSQWQRDVDAFNELNEADKEIRTFDETEKQRASMLATLDREIRRARALIVECETAAKMLGTAANNSYAHFVRRQGELTSGFPHLFAPIDEASSALAKRLRSPEPTA
jgi:hypothetical protein